MRSPYSSKGFATAIIVGGVVVATVVGGIFYFLQGTNPDIVVLDRVDEEDVLAERQEDLDDALLREVQREDSNNYYPLLGLEGDASLEEIEDACRGFECKSDLYYEDPVSFRKRVEACLVLKNPVGRAMYDEWLAGTRETPFPLYYAVLGLGQDEFDQKVLADAYKEQLDLYYSDTSCDKSEVLRLLAEAYLTLNNIKGRAMYDEWLASTDGKPFPLYYAIFGLDEGECAMEDLTDIYQRLLGLYEFGFYGNNPEVPRLLTEAYLTLLREESCALYNSWLSEGGGEDVFGLGDDLQLEDIGSGLRGLSPESIALFLNALGVGSSEIGGILNGIDNLTASNIAGILNSLDGLTATNIGNILNGINNLTASNIAGILNSLDGLTATNIGNILNGINNLTASGLSDILIGLNLSPPDLSDVLGGLDLSPLDLSSVLGGLDLSPLDLSSVLGGLDLSPLDLSSVLGGLDLSPLDLSSVLGGLGLPPQISGAPSPTTPPSGPGGFFQGINLFFSNIFNPSGVPDGDGGRDPQDDGNDLPSLSINAVDPVVSPGENAVFEIKVSGPTISEDTDIFYRCLVRRGDTDLADSRYLADDLSVHPNVEIRIPTNLGKTGEVECSLRGDSSSYRIGKKTDYVSVGLFDDVIRARVRDYYDPSLPTVSVVAYKRGDDNIGFAEVVDSVIVNSEIDNLGLFGLVIDDFDFLANLVDDLDSVTVISKEPEDAEGCEGHYSLIAHPSDPEGRDEYCVDADLNLIRFNKEDNYKQVIRSAHFQPLTDDYGGVMSLEKRGGGIVLRRIVDKEESFVICGRNDDLAVCGDFTESDDIKRPNILRVGIQCFREFSDKEAVEKYLREVEGKRQTTVGDRELIGLFIGGRYRNSASDGYEKVVSEGIGFHEGVPNRPLFELFLPTGAYYDIDSGAFITLDTPVGIDVVPFTEFEGSISCEIVERDGYNINPAAGKALLKILPQPLVSLYGDEGGKETTLTGNVTAIVRRGHQSFEFNAAGIPKSGGGARSSGSYDLKSLGVVGDVGASFLLSFGECYAADWLNKGIGAITSRLGFGGDVGVKDEKLRTKECGLDQAVAAGSTEVLSAIARDYITWAQEGFKNQPLFVQNPTTFYKNMRDDAVGRAIDRSGLGFLCDATFGLDADFFNAKIRLELQHRYSQARIKPPRCTYSALRNNLDEYADDVREFRRDVDGLIDGLADAKDLTELFRVLDADVSFTAQSSPSGDVIDITPTRSEASKQLDALHNTLRNSYEATQTNGNFLLSLARVDEAVAQAKREIDAVASPPGQIFNPNDPQSVAAFEKCSDAENPEGAEDCYVIKGSATFISRGVADAIAGPAQKAADADEWGELGQLVRLAAEATTTGIFKKMLSGNFAQRVPRSTIETLGEIGSGNSEEFRASEIGLGKHWWSVFFDDNSYYNDLVNSEMYALDLNSLLQYTVASLYRFSIGPKGEKKYVPPSTPYADFFSLYVGEHMSKEECEVPKGQGVWYNDGGLDDCHAYKNLKNKTQSDLSSRYFSVLFSTPGSAVETLLEYLSGTEEGDARDPYRQYLVFRFADAYRFLSNINARREYDSFLERSASDSIERTYQPDRNYEDGAYPKTWTKEHKQQIPEDVRALTNRDALVNKLADNLTPEVTYPETSNNLQSTLSGEQSKYEKRVAAVQAVRDIYEATLAAHIEIVGTPDEYSGFADIDPHADSERRKILKGKQYSSAYEAWKVVRDEILQQFRDGTLKVYIPVYDDAELVDRGSRGFSPYTACLGGESSGSSDGGEPSCSPGCTLVSASCGLGIDLDGDGQEDAVKCIDEEARSASTCKFNQPVWQATLGSPLGHDCTYDSCVCKENKLRPSRCSCE